MAYVFPLSTAQFFARLPVREMTFDIPESMELSETGGGEVLTANLGPRLWQGEVTLGDMLPTETDEVTAALDVLRNSGASFMACDRRRPWPRADWKGAQLAGVTPTLAVIAPNMREIRLAGLPPGYQLSKRDYLAFTYGSEPQRHALHRLANTAEAGPGGMTDLVEVSPPIRPGATVGAEVTLVHAACKAVIVPGSVQPGREGPRLTTGASFRFIQTLR